MQKPSSSKNTIYIAIIVIALGTLAYFYFRGNPTDTNPTLQETSTNNADQAFVGSNVLTLLNQINSLKIDTSLFNSQVYKSLVDHTVIVRSQNVGRANPFVPLFPVHKKKDTKK